MIKSIGEYLKIGLCRNIGTNIKKNLKELDPNLNIGFHIKETDQVIAN
jgi:hypothetical protein